MTGWFLRLVAPVSVWDVGRRLSGSLLSVVKRIGVGYLLGGIGRGTGEPKARHSHLKPRATNAVAPDGYRLFYK